MKKILIYLAGILATLLLFWGALGLSTKLSGVITYIAKPGFWGDISKTWWVWLLFVVIDFVIWFCIVKRKSAAE